MKIDELIKQLPITETRVKFLDKLCKELPKGDVVECGVYKGWSASVLVNALEGKKKIYLCDSFEGFPKLEKVDVLPEFLNIHKGSHPVSVWKVKSFFGKLNLSIQNVKFVEGYFESTMPLLKLKIDKIALLHFDGDLYSGCVAVLKNLLPLVVSGGYIVIHDYPRFPAVKKAVEEFFDPKDLVIKEGEIVYFKKP